jgi:putative aldouronate transport system substrate-binding protein
MQINMRYKAVGSISAIVILMGSVMAGCAPEPKNSQEANVKSEKKPNITASIYERGNVPPEMGTTENSMWTKWVNENGPVNVKYIPVPRNESPQKFNVLFASDDAPDVIFEYDANYRNQLYTQKQIMPLDDLIEKHSTVYKKFIKDYPIIRKAGTKSDGKMYEFGRLFFSHSYNGLFIRNDWLKKLNLKVPETTEELVKVAKAFAEQDPDGNGQKDTYGIALSSATGTSIDYMFQNVQWILENGNMIRDWERQKTAMQYKKQIYDSGITDKDYLTDNNGEKAMQDWINGKLGIIVGRTIDVDSYNKFYASLKKNQPNAEVIPIALPKSQYGQFGLTPNNPVQMTAVINAKAKDPVAVMKFIDFLSSESTGKSFRYGFEGTHYTVGSNGCPEAKDQDKYKKEISWNGDFQMLTSTFILGKCTQPAYQLNPALPIEKEFIDIINKNNEINLNPNIPFPQVTHNEHMPTLPQDLQIINTNLNKTLTGIYSKAIVSGSAYSADQAMTDAKSAWDGGQGKKLETFYADWYKNNKDKAFLTSDLYKYVIK